MRTPKSAANTKMKLRGAGTPFDSPKFVKITTAITVAIKTITGKGKTTKRTIADHFVNNVSKTKKHNVRIETVFSKIKDRVNDFRGLKALWSAPIIMAGIILQHNYIQAHTTTRQFPCELAGLSLETGVNRWLGLIKMASCC